MFFFNIYALCCSVTRSSSQAKELGLRVPDAVVSVYPALLCRTVISPSRSLSIMDPLLPIGILLSCLQAYTGASPDKTTLAKRQELRAKIQLHKGKKPHSDDSDDLLEEEDGTSPIKRSNSVISRSQSLRKAVRTLSTVNKSDVEKKPPSRPPPPSNSPSLKRTQSLQVKSSPPPRPPPPRSNTVSSLPVVPPPEQPLIETLPTPGFLEADKDVSSDFQEKEELENVLESVIIEEGEGSFKEESSMYIVSLRVHSFTHTCLVCYDVTMYVHQMMLLCTICVLILYPVLTNC